MEIREVNCWFPPNLTAHATAAMLMLSPNEQPRLENRETAYKTKKLKTTSHSGECFSVRRESRTNDVSRLGDDTLIATCPRGFKTLQNNIWLHLK